MSEMRTHMPETPDVTGGLPANVEPDRLKDQLAKTTAELAEARREIARLQADNARLQLYCDSYVKSLYALMPPSNVTFTEEELADLEQNGVRFDQILDDISRITGK